MSPRSRTPSDQLVPLVKAACARLRRLPKYQGKRELPIATVAKEAGISRGAINTNDELKNLCKGLNKGGQPLLEEAKPLTEVERELGRLIKGHAKYDALLQRMAEYQEEVTTTIWDRYTETYAQLELRNQQTVDAEPLRRMNNQLRDEIVQLRRELETQRLLNKGVEKDSLSIDKVTPLHKTYVVSPDAYLIENNVYTWDKPRANHAWAKARRRFEELLRTTNSVKVYLMCGVQCSGKSTWIKQHKPAEPGVHIYFDAVLKSSAERADLAATVREFCPTAQVVCVRILASLDTCLARQRDRAGKSPESKLVPPNVIQASYDTFEPIEEFEPFDVIEIVRTEGGHV